MGNNSVPKFIFRLSRFPLYRGSVLGRFYCTIPVQRDVFHQGIALPLPLWIQVPVRTGAEILAPLRVSNPGPSIP